MHLSRRRTEASLSRYAQQLDYDCGRSVVAAACWSVGLSRRDAVRVSKLSQPTETDGACPSTVESMLRAGGLSVCSGTMDLEDLRHHVECGRVVLCPIGVRGGHWVLVLGVSINGVRYWCPAAGGSLQEMSLPEWAARWKDCDRWGRAWARWGVACWAADGLGY